MGSSRILGFLSTLKTNIRRSLPVFSLGLQDIGLGWASKAAGEGDFVIGRRQALNGLRRRPTVQDRCGFRHLPTQLRHVLPEHANRSGLLSLWLL